MNEAGFDELVKIAGPVSRETFLDIQRFVAELRRWNEASNLVAPSTLDDVWRRHVLDSAQLFGMAPLDAIWVDLGSGGGFPGLITAFLLRGSSEARVHLVESNRKKAGFLQAMIGKFGLPAVVHGRRIEDVHLRIPHVDAISSRALAPLNKLLEFSEPWLSGNATGFFHKGRDYRREIEESSHGWRYELVEHPSVVESQSVILQVSNLART